MSDNEAKENTDRELWVEPIPPTGLEPARLFVTKTGGIGINVGGYVVVRPLREWHQLTHPGDVVAYERVLAFLQQERVEAEGHTEDMACLDRVIERVVTMLEVAGNAARRVKDLGRTETVRKGEAELLALREALEKADCALKPLTDCVYNDNGDMTVSGISAGYEACVTAYYASKRNRAALAATAASAERIVAEFEARAEGRVREQCAQIADDYAARVIRRDTTSSTMRQCWENGVDDACVQIAATIRGGPNG